MITDRDRSIETGYSNTQFPAQPRTTPHIDYLTVKLPWRSAEIARGLWKTFVQHPTLIVKKGEAVNLGGFDRYPDSFSSLNNSCTGGYEEREVDVVRKGFARKGKEKQVRFFIKFSGRYFDRLTIEDQYELLSCLYAAGFEPTRIDFALDFDPVNCPWTLEDVADAHARRHFKGFGTRSLTKSQKRGDRERGTYYFGSRVSDKLLRVYEHGEVPRFELEVKGRTVRESWKAVAAILGAKRSRAESIQQFRELISSYVLGCIDFRDRSITEQQKIDGKLQLRAAYRSQRLPWWQAVLDCAISEPVKLVASMEVVPSYSRTRDWIGRQVANSLALLDEFHERSGMGDFDQVIREMVQCAKRRMTKRSKQKLKIWLAEKDLSPAFCS